MKRLTALHRPSTRGSRSQSTKLAGSIRIILGAAGTKYMMKLQISSHVAKLSKMRYMYIHVL